jgi:hypothetical protein
MNSWMLFLCGVKSCPRGITSFPRGTSFLRDTVCDINHASCVLGTAASAVGDN